MRSTAPVGRMRSTAPVGRVRSTAPVGRVQSARRAQRGAVPSSGTVPSLLCPSRPAPV
jgi:hypothetical protein